MPKVQYSVLRTAETMLGGLAGGFAYSITRDGIGIFEMGGAVILFLMFVFLYHTLYGWYESNVGEDYK